MPCSDPRSGWDAERTSAMLCGLMTMFDESDTMSLLDSVDWDACGVERDWLEHWWHRHKEWDESQGRPHRHKPDGPSDGKKYW